MKGLRKPVFFPVCGGFKKIFVFLKITLAFFGKVCYDIQAVRDSK